MNNCEVERNVKFSRTRSINFTDHEVKNLPLCLIEEILLKLPIKSVFRCKCVHKSWYDLVSSPIFSKRYAKSLGFTRILGSRDNDVQSLYLLEISEGAGFGDIIKLPFNPPTDNLTAPACLVVVGSCNGLCCVLQCYRSQMKKIFICNPMTGDYVEVPNEKYHSKLEFIYLFGFCPSNGTYKVVRFAVEFTDDDDPDLEKVVGQIFTIGVDKKWRNLEGPFFPSVIIHYPSVYFNGAVHWFGDTFDFMIYAFDFEEEKGRSFNTPPEYKKIAYDKLTVLDDCLCAIITHKDLQNVVWVMKEYGVAESWTEDINLRNLVSYFTRPQTLLKVGRVLHCPVMDNLLVYDQKEKEYSTITCNFQSYVTFIPCFSSIKDVIAEKRSKSQGEIEH